MPAKRRKSSKREKLSKLSKAKREKLSKLSKAQLLARLIKREESKHAPKKEKSIPAKEISATLARQREREKQSKLRERAEKALRSFRVRKSDADTIVFVGTKGKRDAVDKGRKGYAVHVSKTGKKTLLPDTKQGLKSVKLSELNIPLKKNLKKAFQKFHYKTRKPIAKRVLAPNKLDLDKKPYDFSDKVVKEIADTIDSRLKGQQAQRNFIIKVAIAVKKPDGSLGVYEFEVPYAKPDRLEIEKGGIRNFVQQKFYALFAKQLAFDGYITSGSANHIRKSLGLKRKATRKSWQRYHREMGHEVVTGKSGKENYEWMGDDFTTVKIETIEYRIEQA